MYRKMVYWCRKHKMYSTLSSLVWIENKLRFRLSESKLNTWYMNTGKDNSAVKQDMWIYGGLRWSDLTLDDKRHMYGIAMYY